MNSSGQVDLYTVCGWIYDEDIEGIPFEEQPDDYISPLGVPKIFLKSCNKRLSRSWISRSCIEISIRM